MLKTKILTFFIFLILGFSLGYSAIAQSFISEQRQGVGSKNNETISGKFESNEGKLDLGNNTSAETEKTEKLNLETLDRISELIVLGEHNQALSILNIVADESQEGFFSRNSNFELQEYKLFLTIKSHFHLGHFETVESLSNKYLSQYVNGKHFHWVYYYLSSVLHSQNRELKQVYLVTEDFFANLPKQERHNLRKYLIENALRKREFLSAVYFLEDEKGKLIQGYEQWIDEIIENINELDDIEQILERYEKEEIYYQLQKRKVQLMIRNGQIAKAEEYYNELVLKPGSESDQYEKLSSIFKIIRLAKDTKPQKIGVILPFSHRRFKILAREVLDGLEMGMRKIEIGGKPIQLILKDSSQKDDLPEFRELSPQLQLLEKQQLVKNQVKDLVENHGVIAILGPLARTTSLAAGEAAQEYRIPVISFSITENLGKDLPFLFRFQQSQLLEAKVLANYAFDYLNAKRFVLFYNSSSKSFDVMQTFAEEIQAKGGKIVGISRINPQQKDFSDSFRSFTGGLRELTEEEEEELKKTREQPNPVIDFDAIFLPVGTRTLKIAMDFAKFFEADNVWYLSGSEINVPENQLLDNTRRLRFVDTYPISSVKTYLQPFFEAHWKFFNYRANYYSPTNYTIYAYEALEMIGKLMQDQSHFNREALKNAIGTLQSFRVLTGEVNVNQNGELDKQLKLLKIVGTDTVEVF